MMRTAFLVEENRKWQDEIDAVQDAGRLEWQHLIMENTELQADLRKLRRRYGLPIDAKEKQVWMWWEAQVVAGLPYEAELRDCATRHGISWELWGDALRAYLVYNKFYLPVHEAFSGLPIICGGNSDDGESYRRLTIGPYVHVTNPLVQWFIKQLQKGMDEPPPQPVPARRNSRANDWTPTAIWYLRHYSVGKTALAFKLNRNRVTVSRKVNAILAKIGMRK